MKASRKPRASERPIGDVPRRVLAVLLVALALQCGWHLRQPAPAASAADLGLPPALPQRLHGGDAISVAQWLLLYLQSFDNQPGISIPFSRLDYPQVLRWLSSALSLDPATGYPLLMASQIYSQVPDPNRQRVMCDFVHQRFLEAPDTRWRWLAHCAIMAKHRLKDRSLALRYATAIAEKAGKASTWARQMRIFMLEEMGELDSARVLLGGLLANGEVSDDTEKRFLTERLLSMESAQKSTGTTNK